MRRMRNSPIARGDSTSFPRSAWRVRQGPGTGEAPEQTALSKALMISKAASFSHLSVISQWSRSGIREESGSGGCSSNSCDKFAARGALRTSRAREAILENTLLGKRPGERIQQQTLLFMADLSAGSAEEPHLCLSHQRNLQIGEPVFRLVKSTTVNVFTPIKKHVVVNVNEVVVDIRLG